MEKSLIKKKCRVLNLYAGIGGNRKLWENVEVIAVENNRIIAEAYARFFPDDKVIIGDAHQYLIEHFKEFDFIWSSPPCQSHSKIRKVFLPHGRTKPIYADMGLYQEIILLFNFATCPFVVENVKGYYNPLIKPQVEGRHYFWSNFKIPRVKTPRDLILSSNIKHLEANKGFNLDFVKGLGKRKDQVLKNCVNSELGREIYLAGFKKEQMVLNLGN